MKTKINLLLVAFALIFIISCKKDKDDNNTPIVPIAQTPTNSQGLGNNSGFPTGTLYELPQSIEIEGEIRGGMDYYYSGNDNVDKKNMKLLHNIITNKNINEDDWQYYGSGTYVELYMKFYNTSAEDTIVIIPGGLIFIDSTKTYQHGFVLQTVSIPVLAHDTTYAVVNAYCSNLDRDCSDWDAIYHFGPVTNNSELIKIVEIMEEKEEPEDFYVIYEIQDMIWDVTDYNKVLSQQQLSYLNDLP